MKMDGLGNALKSCPLAIVTARNASVAYFSKHLQFHSVTQNC